MLVRDKRELFSGVSAISKHAVDAILPELIPGPNVPKPAQKAAAKQERAPIILLSDLIGVKRSSREIRTAKIIGVSIIAWLIKVKGISILYASLFNEILLLAIFANRASPKVGPMLPMPMHKPLANKRMLFDMVASESSCALIKSEIKKLKITGV